MWFIFFDEIATPAAQTAVAKTSNSLDDSLVMLAMPIVKSEAMEFMAELEEKVEAKIDEKLGQDAE